MLLVPAAWDVRSPHREGCGMTAQRVDVSHLDVALAEELTAARVASYDARHGIPAPAVEPPRRRPLRVADKRPKPAPRTPAEPRTRTEAPRATPAASSSASGPARPQRGGRRLYTGTTPTVFALQPAGLRCRLCGVEVDDPPEGWSAWRPT
ncbi:hypothetical protein BN12_1510016 [Nostocoides japonicum T1-X7]|uniref:Uncharacterized protein n=1 Tax=Nostocoides japonicum T1-X7 TaxID=1194083 RepID=A0A077LTK2_9MICO|nr:hypothetical protein BN12_1510016 [Tetrasphaera japonica T1-X7]